MTAEDPDPQIQCIWLEVLARRIAKGDLPSGFRDRVLLKLLNSPKWTFLGSASFGNLAAMERVLQALCSGVQSGNILVLNFVFQNLMLRGLDKVPRDSRGPPERGRRGFPSSQKVN